MSIRIIIGLLIAAVLAAGGAFLLANKNTSKTNQEQSSTSSKELAKNSQSSPSLPKQTVGQQPDCSLYSLEDMAKIWGVPMTDTDIDGSKVIQITGPQDYQYECDYNETNTGKGLTVSIQYKVYKDEAAAKTSINDTRSSAKFGDTVYFVQDEVKNVGDEAFFSLPVKKVDDPNNEEEQMYARKGNVVFLLSAVNLDGVDANYRDKLVASYNLHLQ